MVNQRYWADDIDDMDRQRRKQAEFLVHRFCPWELISGIAVIDSPMQARVQSTLADHEVGMRRPVAVRRAWYYH